MHTPDVTKESKMDKQAFGELLDSAGQALDHARHRRDLRTTMLPPPPRPMSAAAVKRLRKKINASQAVFAHYLNVSAKLVQAWESNRRRPDGPALVLLRMAQRDPGLVFDGVKIGTRTRR